MTFILGGSYRLKCVIYLLAATQPDILLPFHFHAIYMTACSLRVLYYLPLTSAPDAPSPRKLVTSRPLTVLETASRRCSGQETDAILTLSVVMFRLVFTFWDCVHEAPPPPHRKPDDVANSVQTTGMFESLKNSRLCLNTSCCL